MEEGEGQKERRCRKPVHSNVSYRVAKGDERRKEGKKVKEGEGR